MPATATLSPFSSIPHANPTVTKTVPPPSSAVSSTIPPRDGAITTPANPPPGVGLVPSSIDGAAPHTNGQPPQPPSPPHYSSTPAMHDYSKDKQQREEQYQKQATDELIDLCLFGFSIVGPGVYSFIILMATEASRYLTAASVVFLLIFNVLCNSILARTKQHALKSPIRSQLTVFRFFINDLIGSLMVLYDRPNGDSAWWLFCFFNIVGGSLDFGTVTGAIINDIIHVAVGSWWCWLSGRSLSGVGGTTVTLTLVAIFFTGVAVTLRTSRIAMHTSVDRKKLYLAHIAHELRTPLTGILGISSMLKEELASSSASTSSSSAPSPSSSGQAQLSSGQHSSPYFVPRRHISPVHITNPSLTSSVLQGAHNQTMVPSPIIPGNNNGHNNNNERKQSFAGINHHGNASNNNHEVIAMVNTLSICTDSLLQVANAVLDISKIEAGALVLRNDPLDLRLVVEEVTELARASAIQLRKDVRISCDVSQLACPSLLPAHIPSGVTSSPLATPSIVGGTIARDFLAVPSTAVQPKLSPTNAATTGIISVAGTNGTSSSSSMNPRRCCLYAEQQNGRCCSGAHVLSDGQRIRQLLVNLMNNAVKFTSEGSVSLSVTRVPKSPRSGSSRFLFSVSDTGVGVPDHLRESIFEPFMQGPQGGSGQAGTGLGLYISRRLAEAFGGTVYVKPNNPKGSIFCLELNLTLRTDCTLDATQSQSQQPQPNQSPGLYSSTISQISSFQSSYDSPPLSTHCQAWVPLTTFSGSPSSRFTSPSFSFSSSSSSSSSPAVSSNNSPLIAPVSHKRSPLNAHGRLEDNNGHSHSPSGGPPPSHPRSHSRPRRSDSPLAKSSPSLDPSESDHAASYSPIIHASPSDHSHSPPHHHGGHSHHHSSPHHHHHSSRSPRSVPGSGHRSSRRIRLATVVNSSSNDRLQRMQQLDSTLNTNNNGNYDSSVSDSLPDDVQHDIDLEHDPHPIPHAPHVDDNYDGDSPPDAAPPPSSSLSSHDIINDEKGSIRRRSGRRRSHRMEIESHSCNSSIGSSNGSNGSQNSSGGGNNGNASGSSSSSNGSTGSNSHALMRAAALRRFRQQTQPITITNNTNNNSNPNSGGMLITSNSSSHQDGCSSSPSPSPSPDPPIDRESLPPSASSSLPSAVPLQSEVSPVTSNSNSSSPASTPTSTSPPHSPSSNNDTSNGATGQIFFPVDPRGSSSSSSSSSSSDTASPLSSESLTSPCSTNSSSSNPLTPAASSSSSTLTGGLSPNSASRTLANSNTPPPNASNRVLLVEDVHINRAVIARMLTRLGLPADEARDGREAVDMAMKRHYDFILMDCQMPIMDGYTATETIRNTPGPNQHSRIIAFTASTLPGDREKCLRAGMSEYVTKPVSFPTLRALL